MPNKKKLLILSDWFEPAFKAGGPIRSAVNFVRQMKNECEICVLTSDLDMNDIKPMKGITANQWMEYVPGVKVFYASQKNLTLKNIKEYIDSVDPDIIYLNSMFSKKFTVYPLWLKRTNRISPRIVLAPRGMLKGSALHFKKRKKKIFLSLLKWMQIPQLVTFHATDDQEEAEIAQLFGKQVKINTIPNFPGSQEKLLLPDGKQKGFLKILFIGRIHPIKGLDILLNALKKATHNIHLTIAGNPEDISYQNLCRKIIRELPANIEVNFANEIPHHGINELIRVHHLFCLPTKGENFGHAIFEALSAGRPVLISDQTPWRNLTYHKAGWNIPLGNPEKFTEVIEKVALMNSGELNEWCEGAWKYCENYLESSNLKQQYLKLFS